MKKSTINHTIKYTIKYTKKKTARITAVILIAIYVLFTAALPVAAAGDGVTTTLTSFMDLLFSVIKIAGFGLAAWGLINIVIALNSHDPQQRLQGIMFFAGGLIVFFVKEILQAIGVQI